MLYACVCLRVDVYSQKACTGRVVCCLYFPAFISSSQRERECEVRVVNRRSRGACGLQTVLSHSESRCVAEDVQRLKEAAVSLGLPQGTVCG